MGEGAGRDALNSNPPLVVRSTPIWTAFLGLGAPPEVVCGRRTAARAVPLADQGATPSSSCPPSPPPPPTRTTCRSRSRAFGRSFTPLIRAFTLLRTLAQPQTDHQQFRSVSAAVVSESRKVCSVVGPRLFTILSPHAGADVIATQPCIASSFRAHFRAQTL